MSRFLVALMILSLFAIAQGRVIIAPSASPAVEIESRVALSDDLPTEPTRASMGGLPESFSIFFLLTGLSGLAAAGNRPSRTRSTLRR